MHPCGISASKYVPRKSCFSNTPLLIVSWVAYLNNSCVLKGDFQFENLFWANNGFYHFNGRSGFVPLSTDLKNKQNGVSSSEGSEDIS